MRHSKWFRIIWKSITWDYSLVLEKFQFSVFRPRPKLRPESQKYDDGVSGSTLYTPKISSKSIHGCPRSYPLHLKWTPSESIPNKTYLYISRLLCDILVRSMYNLSRCSSTWINESCLQCTQWTSSTNHRSASITDNLNDLINYKTNSCVNLIYFENLMTHIIWVISNDRFDRPNIKQSVCITV